MNLQVALGHRRHLLLHAAAVERGGRAIVMTGESGAGKSTLLRMIKGELYAGDEEISLQKGARLGSVDQEAPASARSLMETVLEQDAERAALLAEAETASDPHRIAEIQTRLADIEAHSAEARAGARRDLAGHERVGQRHLQVLPQLLGHELVRGVRRVRQRHVQGAARAARVERTALGQKGALIIRLDALGVESEHVPALLAARRRLTAHPSRAADALFKGRSERDLCRRRARTR